MPKLEWRELVIEITRRCNMSCEHCLRGKQENIDMSMDTIEPLLNMTDEINSLTFSGGEPSLNIPLMQKILKYCKSREIPVCNIYVVTNGKTVSNKFLYTLIEWYSYCIKSNNGFLPDISSISLSQDKYHEKIPKENINKLRSLAFFNKDHYCDFDKRPVLAMGKGENISGNIKREISTKFDTIEVDEHENTIRIDGLAYVSAKGDILTDCDLSYDKMKRYAVGNTQNMPAFIDYLYKK